MANRARFIYTFTLASGIFMLGRALTDPPHSLWRVFFDIILPIAITLASAWALMAIRKR
ncbi:MAG: hypothetical protein ABSH28_11060 [Acidobacteriota bacterium]